MKGRETSMNLLTANLFYLYEGPRDPQKPPEEEFVIPIRRADRPPSAS